MTTYTVTIKTTGQEVYHYSAAEPVEWTGMEFSTHDHTAVVDAPIPPAQPGPRRLTKLAYMNRFTDAELATIYSAAKVSVAVEIWLAKFNATTPEADGTAIALDDPRTVVGLQAMEAGGLIGPGRALEILA